MAREHNPLSIAFLLRSESEDRREQHEPVDVREVVPAECSNDIKGSHRPTKEDTSTKRSATSYVRKPKRRRRRIEEPVKGSEMKVVSSKPNASVCSPILYMTEDSADHCRRQHLPPLASKSVDALP